MIKHVIRLEWEIKLNVLFFRIIDFCLMFNHVVRDEWELKLNVLVLY